MANQQQPSFAVAPPQEELGIPFHGNNNASYPPQQQQQFQGYPPPYNASVAPPVTQQQQAYPTTPQGGTPTHSGPPRRVKKKPEDNVLITRTPDQETEDGRIRNSEAAGKIRENWIYKQVRARRNEFTNYRKATVYVGTWNVNAKGKDEPLDQWLCADWGPNREYPPDIVAVGFQEIVDLNAVNVAVDNKTQQKSQFWAEKLEQTLNSYSSDPNRSYTLLSQKSLVGLLVCVFVKAAHRDRVRYISATSVGVGVMGFAGNKGGVSIRLQFYDSTLCFVCAHLAAHRENVTGRNADFANVYNKTSFEVGEEAVREVIRSGGSLSSFGIATASIGIQDHDIVFWLGDLNYRIEDLIPTERVLQLAEKGALVELRAIDQLNLERIAGRAFDEFEEGELNFPPTYKYQPGTDVYDQRPDKKIRAPAWCDRILWRSQEESCVEQVTYRRSEAPNISDHKPVYSTFRVTVKDVIKPKREAIYGELMSLLDRYENQTLPMVALDRVTLDFGEVRYDQSIELPIKITNTGSVVAQFRLKPKLDERNVCKPWLSVTPTFGMLIPGESPATMNFILTIDNDTAQSLNSGREVLDDILILGLEGGRDYYITVKATYARSCFGMSIDELVMYSQPVRTVPLDPIKRAEKVDPSGASALCVPKELWRIVDAIYEKGLDAPHIFAEPGVPDEICQIRECLDTGAQFGHYQVHSYAQAFLLFLSSLSASIIPLRVFPVVDVDSQNIQALARKVLEELPPIHYNVFVYVISFFRETLLYRQRNQLTAAKLARICCDCLAPVRNQDTSSASMQKRTGMQLILLHLLETSSI